LETVNDITVHKNFVLGSYSNQNVGNFVDLTNYYIYTVDGANVNQGAIDMILLHSAGSNMNLFTPTSTRFTGWGSTKHIPTEWTQRNDGVLMRLPNPSIDELALFENASSVSDLLTAYSYYASTITDRPGYNSTNDGPATSIRQVDAGGLVVYYSVEREVISIFKVKAVEIASSGSLTMEAKTGQFDAGDMLNSGALTFGGWSTSGSEGA